MTHIIKKNSRNAKVIIVEDFKCYLKILLLVITAFPSMVAENAILLEIYKTLSGNSKLKTCNNNKFLKKFINYAFHVS